jgi:hypothetical protein
VSYSISISGHHPHGAEGEQQLHDELNAVLAKPEHGVTGSRFSGQHVLSNRRLLVKPEHATHTHEHDDTDGDQDADVEL